MREPVESEMYKGKKIEILYDESPENPRHDENVGTMICAHRRYDLGDSQVMPDEARARVARVKKAGGVVYPIYMYDHSALAFSISNEAYPFNDPWDAGQVGFIYADATKIRSVLGCKRITKKVRERVTEILEAELQTYQSYINGEVYGYRVTISDTEVDSCYGFYSTEDALAEARSVVDHTPEETK